MVDIFQLFEDILNEDAAKAQAQAQVNNPDANTGAKYSPQPEADPPASQGTALTNNSQIEIPPTPSIEPTPSTEPTDPIEPTPIQ